jgi:hypothetical protein
VQKGVFLSPKQLFLGIRMEGRQKFSKKKIVLFQNLNWDRTSFWSA